ncbi:hypothetical protein Ark11_0882 [Candidatus Ichthyocystis hellenicum]|uniref:Uncharacterized protein n=3 Tax=Candidatus Ichthyocystis TaxID=2929841 RepID=A0A0S4M1Q9_9BURK|nr:hypothetical protein [Candidatus Ichthyocystis hellenicum]CUT17705.1 hypothetical protein Ark11_0882 [Candidatus Ichthyocystis hellenicum]
MDDGKIGCPSHQVYQNNSGNLCAEQSFDLLNQCLDYPFSHPVLNPEANEMSLPLPMENYDSLMIVNSDVHTNPSVGYKNNPITFDSHQTISSIYSFDLVKDLCFGYGFNTCFDGFDKIFEDSFFQIHAHKYGYELTSDFLSDMNVHKDDFSIFIDSVLSSSSASFDGGVTFYNSRLFKEEMDFFVKKISEVSDVSTPGVIELLDKACSYFSRYVYDLRSKCVCILRTDFIPAIVKTILNNNIMNYGSERKMTYPEMEMFFLHSVTSLERMVILKAMYIWNDFFKGKELIFSLPLHMGYSNPFIHSSVFCGLEIPVVDYPAAFSFFDNTEICISLFSITRINGFIKEISDKIYGVLDGVISDEIAVTSDTGFDYVTDFNVFRTKTLPALIKVKFDEMLLNDQTELNNMIFELMMWNSREDKEVDLLMFRDLIVKSAYKSLELRLHSLSDSVIGYFSRKIDKFISKKEGRYCRLAKNKWRVNIHPKLDYNVLSIKSRFLIKLKPIFCSKIYSLIEDGFPKLSWDDVSAVLFQILEKEAEEVISDRSDKLADVVTRAPTVDSYDVLALTNSQASKLTSLIMTHSDSSLRSYAKSLWDKVRVSVGKAYSFASVDMTSVIVASDQENTNVSLDSAVTIDQFSSAIDTSSTDHEILNKGAVAAVTMNESSLCPEAEDIICSRELQSLFQSFLDRVVCDGNDFVMSGIEELMSSSQYVKDDKFDIPKADHVVANERDLKVYASNLNPIDFHSTASDTNKIKKCYYKIKGDVSPVFVDFGELRFDVDIDSSISVMLEEHLTGIYNFIKHIMLDLEKNHNVGVDSAILDRLRSFCDDDLSKFVHRMNSFFIDVFVLDVDCGRLINDDERHCIVNYFYNYLHSQYEQIMSCELPNIISMTIK